MRIIVSTFAALMSAAALGAQTPAPAARPSIATPNAEQTPSPEPYTYESQGRRDPFVSLTGTGVEPHATVNGGKAEGPAGMMIAELAVRGVMQSRGTLVAMVSGPDHKTYIVHAGDKLLDGTIKSITSQGMIFIQNVTDPLSLVKQREVSKLLHADEGKE
jgi:Tfp pilus assembly protein PilP